MKNICPLSRRARRNYYNDSRHGWGIKGRGDTHVHLLRGRALAQLFALNRILMHSSSSFAARRVDYALCLTCVNKVGAGSTTPWTRQEEFFEPLDIVARRVPVCVKRCHRSFKKSVSRLPERANSFSQRALNSGIISWHSTLRGTVASLIDKRKWLHLKFFEYKSPEYYSSTEWNLRSRVETPAMW